MPKKIFMMASDRFAQGYYRNTLPYQFCRDKLLAEDIELVFGETLNRDAKYDALYLHRVLQPSFFEAWKEFQYRGTKIACEWDDDLWQVPESNPSSRAFGQMELDTLTWQTNNADMVVVSTPHLKKVTQEHLTNKSKADKVVVAPNLLDWTRYAAVERPPGKIRILWAGSLHHQDDINVLVKPIDHILNKYGQTVEMLWMGDMPDAFVEWRRSFGTTVASMFPTARYGNCMYLVGSVELEAYPQTLCNIVPDIALVPLAECAFNQSKSATKVCEMALAGAAVIATRAPQHECFGDDILQVGDQPREWIEAIDWLLDTDWRKLMASKIKMRVKKDWCWQTQADQWVQMFRRLVND
jgi:glycosyltransferase involved in cell wall biosynthesis